MRRPTPRPPNDPRGVPCAGRPTLSRGTMSMRTFLVLAPLRSCTDRPGRMTFSPGFPSAFPGQLDRKTHHSPLHRHLATRPLPREELPRASAPGSHPRSHVPSSWFHTTSTASSASQSAGLLHPAAGPGVRGFPPLRRRPKVGGVLASSPRRTHTPRRNPRMTAAPRHRGRCPLVVRQRASLGLAPLLCGGGVYTGEGRAASTSRPCSIIGSRNRTAPLLARSNRSFLGFVPLQGPSKRWEIPLRPSTRVRRPPKGWATRKLRSAPAVAERPESSTRAGHAVRRTAQRGRRARRPAPETTAASPKGASGRSASPRPKPRHAPRIGYRRHRSACAGTRYGRNPFDGSPHEACAPHGRTAPAEAGGGARGEEDRGRTHGRPATSAVEVCPELKFARGSARDGCPSCGDPRRPSWGL